MTNDDVWIKRFQNEALPRIINGINGPVKVFVFGSRVTGRATEMSDIDVLIVSDFFQGVPFIRRMEMMLGIAKFEKHVDYLCYTPEEFKRIKASSSVIQGAVENCEELVLSQ